MQTNHTAAPGMNGGTAPPVQINPNEVAHHLLVFMQRVEFRAAERAAFDQCEMVLQALRAGTLVITNAPPKDAPPKDGSDAHPFDPKETN